MNVVEIKPNGFCGGVKKAMQIINEALLDPNTAKPIYMLGYLVHNKKIVNSYQKVKGIILVKDNYLEFLETITKGTIIFTAHGISPKIFKVAEDKNLNIIDTTCVNVKKIHHLIKEKINYSDVIVIGNINHPEVLGYLGISDKVLLYHDSLNIKDNSFIVNQTTLVYDDVLNTFKKIKEKNKTVEISEELCSATKSRQKAIIQNINNFDLFLVIGDKLSNNCTSLYELVIENKKRAYQIEDISELNEIDFSDVLNVGVTAGASTPPAIVNEIIQELKSYHPGKVFYTTLTDEDYLKF